MNKPQIKAQELFNSFRALLSLPDAPFGEDKDKIAIECSLLVIKEVLGTGMLIDEDTYLERVSYAPFWRDVRDELNKMKGK